MSRRADRVRWGLVAVALIAGPTATGCRQQATPADTGGAPEQPVSATVELQRFEFGGDFTLTAHTGQPFRLSDLRGKAVLLFFGYTYCPDVCPTTLGTMAQVEKLLPEQRGRLQTVFVSVDPGRDTNPRLEEYLDHFGVAAIAVTGPVPELDAVVKQYAAFYEKQPSDSAMGYLVDHTSRLYLIDTAGQVRYLFRYGESAERIAEGVRLVLAEAAAH